MSFPVLITDPKWAKRELVAFLRPHARFHLYLTESGQFQCRPQDIGFIASQDRLLVRFDLADRTVTRRVIGYRIDGRSRLLLKLGRFGAEAGEAAIVPAAAVARLDQIRSAYRTQIRSLVKAGFKGARFVKVGAALPGFKHFALTCAEIEGRKVAIVGVNRHEPQLVINRALTAGLCWCAQLERAHDIRSLYVFVPEGRGKAVSNRAKWIDKSKLEVRVFEVGAGSFSELRADRESEDDDYAWPSAGPFKFSGQLLKVIELAPDLIRRHPHAAGYDSLRIRGLEFARVIGARRERIVFGVGKNKEALTAESWPKLEKLVTDIARIRAYDSAQRRHPFYRLQPERWLESLIVEDIKALGPELDPRHVYSQVPAYLGDDRAVLDILSVDRIGRLAVIELKVGEDQDLIMQGLDYWSRICWHNLRGDLQKRGLFAGIRLSREPPVLYLVSPMFRFHKSFDDVLSFISTDVPIIKVGINWDWRRKVQVVRREQISG